MKKAVWIKILLPVCLLLLIFVGAAALFLANPAFTPAPAVDQAVSVSFEDGCITVENRNDFSLRAVTVELYRSGQPGSSIKGGQSAVFGRWEGQDVPAGEALRLETGDFPQEAADLYLTVSYRYGYRLDPKRNTINRFLPFSAAEKE